MEVLILKKSLGKGLDSLIRSNDSPNSSNVNKKSELFITDLLPNSDQPRKKFDEESLRDLSESIKVRIMVFFGSFCQIAFITLSNWVGYPCCRRCIVLESMPALCPICDNATSLALYI